MSHRVLARKWRPQIFEDVKGQENIARSLQNSIKNEQIGQAYLFTGTRGVGKTTLARIFAKSLKCQSPKADGNPCLKCDNCVEVDEGKLIDVHEIDGASNNGVDQIRQLIDEVQYMPVSGKFKIYIIDEVHMLSVSAFNALLKTLEEPPKHVVFILATTESHKLLSTVISRCLRFDFKSASLIELESHLNEICRKEGITLSSSKALKVIARKAKGSFRDSLSILDQVLSYTMDREINDEIVAAALGVSSQESLFGITNAILSGEKNNCLALIDQEIANNVLVKELLHDLLENMYQLVQMIDQPDEAAKNFIADKEIIEDTSFDEILWISENMAKDFSWVLNSPMVEVSLKIVLSKICLRRKLFSSIVPKSHIGPEKKVQTSLEKKEVIKEAREVKPEEKTEKAADLTVKKKSLIEQTKTREKLPKTWEGFINFLVEKYPVLATNLEQGNLLEQKKTSGGEVFEIGFKNSARIFFDFINEKTNRDKISTQLKIYFELDEALIRARLLSNEKTEDNFKSIVEVNVANEDKARQEKEDNIRGHDVVQEAQKIFSSEIDNVYIKTKT